MVFDGRVQVNGVVRRDVLYQVNADRDEITVDGKAVERASRLYLKMNKPVGVLTTVRDPEGRKTVVDLLPEHFKGAMPVGRLDKDSCGLLLLTNDHDFGNLVAGDDSRIRKVYRVVVGSIVDDARVAPLAAGMEIEGVLLKPMGVKIIDASAGKSELEITLTEGKNRQIRRSLEKLGLGVASLERIAIGPLTLDRLKPGDVRTLSSDEVERLSSAGRPRAVTSRAGSDRRPGSSTAPATPRRSPRG